MPERTVGVIHEINADIVGLQEVTFPTEGEKCREAGHLLNIPGMHLILGPTLLRGENHFGNVLLTRHPAVRVDRIDLSVQAREPRGAIDVDVDVGGIVLRVIVTHLGLKGYERRSQIDNLLSLVRSRQAPLTVLMGDFNVWFPRSSLFPTIEDILGHAPALRTYPSRFPLLRLDRIWVKPESALRQIFVHRTTLAQIASDHLPVKAILELPVD